MTDFATLRLDADTTGMVLAVDALKDVQGEAQKTEAAVTDAMGGVGRGFKNASVGAQGVVVGMDGVAKGGKAAAGAAGALASSLSNVARSGISTGNWLGAVASEIGAATAAFGAFGIAAGIAGEVVVTFIGYLMRESEEAKKATEKLEKLKAAYEDLSASSENIQIKIDKLRFGVDEEFQVEILREQVRLRSEYTAKVAELNGYLATTTDSIDRQRISSAALREEIQGIASKYQENERLLAQQQNRATQLAIIEGERATAAGRIAALQRDAAAEAERQHRAMVSAYQTYADTRKEGEALADAAARAGVAASDLSHIAFGNLSTASDEALRLAGNLGIALDTASKLAGLGPQGVGGNDPSGKVYSGRGGAPSASDMAGIGAFGALGGYWTPPSGSSGGGGGGGGGAAPNALMSELDALRASLMTQEEEQIASYQRQQDTLAAALNQRLVTQQEYNALMQDAQRQHSEAMASIDAYRYGNGLQQAGAFFGDMASAMAGGNNKMLKISRVFAAAQGLINSYLAYTEVLKDPLLPWFARIPAAVGVLSAGLGMVSAIKGVSSGGGSSGRVSATGSQPRQQQAQRPTQTLNFTIENDSFGIGEGIVRQIVTQLNKASRNGSNIVATISS